MLVVFGCLALPPSGLAVRPLASQPLPNRYIVVLKQPAGTQTRAVARDQAREYGVRLQHVYKSVLPGYAATISPAALKRVESDPRVAYVEPVKYMSYQAAPWGLDRIDQHCSASSPYPVCKCPLGQSSCTNCPAGQPGCTVQLNGAFNPRYTGAGVKIYIIDGGVYLGHTDFGGRATFGFAVDGQQGDCNGHGTAVAGLAAGSQYGVAKSATIVSVRAARLPGCSISNQDIITALDWVKNDRLQHGGLSVANISLATGPDNAIDTAVNDVVNVGVVVTIAAGEAVPPNQPVPTCTVSPARVGTRLGAITVNASNLVDGKWKDANLGPGCVDLYAPGVQIVSDSNAGPTAVTPPQDGNSLSAGLTAGAAALYRQSNPADSPTGVEVALENIATTDTFVQPQLLLYTRERLTPGGNNIDTIGVVRPITGGWQWYLTNSIGGDPRWFFQSTPAGGIPVSGDWDGDGVDTPGIFDAGIWRLSNGYDGRADYTVTYGGSGDVPVTGDWNADGRDTIGYRRTHFFYFSNGFFGATDTVTGLGNDTGDVPVVGDWDGNRTDTPGVKRGGEWFLSNGFSGVVNYDVLFGDPGDQPVIGDWNGDGSSGIGLHRQQFWYLLNTPHTTPNPDYSTVYGDPGDRPLAGDWAG
jgi:subtilisin family serine protease